MELELHSEQASGPFVQKTEIQFLSPEFDGIGRDNLSGDIDGPSFRASERNGFRPSSQFDSCDPFHEDWPYWNVKPVFEQPQL